MPLLSWLKTENGWLFGCTQNVIINSLFSFAALWRVLDLSLLHLSEKYSYQLHCGEIFYIQNVRKT